MIKHSSIYFVKELLKSLLLNHDVELICDIHGHFKAKNCFFYGCKTNKTEPVLSYEHKINCQIKLFPFFLSKLSANLNYEKCDFNLAKEKNGTARLVCFKEFQLIQSYTLEVSMFGTSFDESNNNQPNHFTIDNLLQMGQNFIIGLYCLTQTNLISNALYLLENRDNPNFIDTWEVESLVKRELSKIQQQYQNQNCQENLIEIHTIENLLEKMLIPNIFYKFIIEVNINN